MTNVLYQRSFFADIDGKPLDSGKLYIGTANADPELAPVACYWDEALTISATQPLAITAGYVTNNGIRAAVYVASTNYSLRVRNRSGSLVDYIPAISDGSLRSDLLASTALSLIGTPEGTAYNLLYSRTALSLVRGTKAFARNLAEAKTMAADLSGMTGYAAYAGTTGGSGSANVFRVWNAHDNLNTPGCFRWAVYQATVSGGGTILFDTRGFFDIELISLLQISGNTTIDAPARNVRLTATNETHMLRVIAPNVIIRRLNISRRPSLTNVDSEVVTYTATAGQVAFDVTFPFSDPSELRVYRNNVLLTLTTDYTVVGTSTTAGGRVTLVSAATAGETIKIYGDIYQKDGLSIVPTYADRVWIDQCTFTEHSDGALDIASSDLVPTLAATALVVKNRYTITTLGTTDWNVAAGTTGVTYTVGSTFTCAAVGTGTGVVRSADCRVSITRCSFRKQDKTCAWGSSATNLNPVPSWASTALAQTPILLVTMDGCSFEGCGMRKPRVASLCFAHVVNQVDGIGGYHRDDGTTSDIHGAYSTTGGKILMESCYWYKHGAAEAGAVATKVDTAAWDITTRYGPGALLAINCVADDSLTINQANTDSIPTPPYSITKNTIPGTLAARLTYLQTQISNAGAEVSPLSEMQFTFVTKADGDAQGLYPDGYNVVQVPGGYRVRVRDNVPATGVDVPSDITPSSVTIFRGSTITIASDTIQLGSDMVFAIDTEGAAATDTLSTITGGVVGQIIGFRIGTNSRTVTVTSAGNIRVSSDILLDNIGKMMWLQYDTGTQGWLVISGPGPVAAGSRTVAQLPAAGFIGRRSFVTDATVTTFATTVAGGGANKVPVYDDGSAWRIG